MRPGPPGEARQIRAPPRARRPISAGPSHRHGRPAEQLRRGLMAGPLNPRTSRQGLFDELPPEHPTGVVIQFIPVAHPFRSAIQANVVLHVSPALGWPETVLERRSTFRFELRMRCLALSCTTQRVTRAAKSHVAFSIR
ncbi:hypothetical protein G6F65_021691 [Rhizopus arrhizus]|nr:hypothetical protein G6F65_021691 [Rhizopus arrhizus]